MQDPSYTFCNQLRSFCDHLLSMCNNLKTSMNQRPIPLDSSLNPFVEGLNRRATSTNNQVEALESMTIDTISFRELLGHCNELYKQNENAVAVLQDRLKEYGYEPVEIDSSDEPLPFEGISPRADKFAELEALSNHSLAIQIPEQTSMLAASCLSFTATSARDCSSNVLQDDPMFEDSLSLQDLGLSDACLATLAREANTGNWSPECDRPMQQRQERKHQDKKLHSDHWDGPDVLLNMHCPTDSYQSISEEDLGNAGTIREGPIAECLLEVSKEDYDKTPSWLRGLASWEELDDAIGKINSFLSNRAKHGDGKGGDLLHQDDLKPLGFGPKVKPFLLLLVRMNCLTIEHESGATMYRVRLK